MSFVELLEGADSYTSLAEMAAADVSVDSPEATVVFLPIVVTINTASISVVTTFAVDC